MPKPLSIATESTVIMDADAVRETLRRLVMEIIDRNPDLDALVLLGILRKGRPLADRISKHIGDLTGVYPPVGSLATTLYRDDVRAGNAIARFDTTTHFAFSIDGRTVLLVDDVLAAGRTIRAAMDEVMDYGRPSRIQLACLIDRGGRELPIQADYLGWRMAAASKDWVSVKLSELGSPDAVLLEHHAASEERNGVDGGT